jgi:hypothetical protein
VTAFIGGERRWGHVRPTPACVNGTAHAWEAAEQRLQVVQRVGVACIGQAGLGAG